MLRLVQPPGLGRRYGFAALAASVATLLKSILPWAGTESPFLLYCLPVAAAAWFGGLGPAIFCATVCALCANILFLEPRLSVSLDAASVAKTALFLLEAILISYLSRDRRQNNQSAAERRLFYDATLSAIAEAVITTNLRGQIESMNEAAQLLTGWSPADARGRVCGSIVRFQANVHPVAEALESGLAYHSPQPLEMLRRSSPSAFVDTSVLPVRGAGGEICGAVLTLRDRTLQFATQRGLEHRIQELENYAYGETADIQDPPARHS